MKYYLGLDIGTNSIGWALLDENFKLVRKNGFTFWGVRMFDEANGKAERRGYRTQRRRYIRRKQRIEWLREIFIDEIVKIDKTFFQRMDDSFFRLEDKRDKDCCNVFSNTYTDKEFYSTYPTIYHLRKELLTKNKKCDIRVLYLVIHNMVKYRGNFLSNAEEFKKGDISIIKSIFNELNQLLSSYREQYEDDEDYFDEIKINDDFFVQLENIMLSKISKNDKKKKLKDLFGSSGKTLINEALIPLLVGSSVNLSNLKLVRDNHYEKIDINLETETLEDDISKAAGTIIELSDFINFIPSIKIISDNYYLQKLLNGQSSLTDAMISIYEDHKKDLDRLQKLIRTYAKDKYNECFKEVSEKNNYASYVGMSDVSGKMKRFKHCKKDDFYAYLKKIFASITDPDAASEIEYFKTKIENDELLLKQNSSQNAAIPMQLNLSELKEILKNQENYYPFLLNKDENGITNSEKIISIFKYKLPYYVGPLNSKEYGWVVRNEEKIYPWNFKNVINLDETAKQFILKMQNKCTYLKGEDDYCLPKKSIIFSEYNCLSYLNKLKINGKLINNDIKEEIFNNIFLTSKKPTKKYLANFIISKYGSTACSSNGKEIPEITCDMSSYITFCNILGKEYVDNNIDLIERIISDITVFEDKDILEERLKNIYSLNEKQIKDIKGLNYSGYGRLSRRLLNELVSEDPSTGEVYGTILEIMRKTNLNLNEILYSTKYNFNKVIDDYNEKYFDKEMDLNDFIDEHVNVSPIMKRPLIQALTIIDEIEKIIKQPISKFFIECARTNKDKNKNKASVSRYNNIKNLYESCKDIANQYSIDLNHLSKELEENKDNLRSEKLYLYFTQLGRCMYSLKPIDIDDLNKSYICDIDHIYPQSLIKDDSFSNRVLTFQEYNKKKTDKLISEIDNFLNPKAPLFYQMLLEKQLITKEKYRRLTNKEVSEEELQGFINRQIVVTNQATKGLIEVLKNYKNIPAENIIYSKAENISDFRKDNDFIKSRLANNYHHAHDAYLNVLVGGILDHYYKYHKFYYVKDYNRLKAEGLSINPRKILNNNQYIDGKLVWDHIKIKKQIKHDLYERFDVNETTRTYNPKELFKKVSILPAGKGNIPVKACEPYTNIDIYGGINSNSLSRYVIIKTINKKGIIEYYLEAIPKIYDRQNSHGETDFSIINQYLSKKFTNYEIVHSNIKVNVVIKQNKLKFAITGKSSSGFLLINLNDRNFNYNNYNTIRKIEKYYDLIKKGNKVTITENSIILSPKTDVSDGIILDNIELDNLFDDIKNKYSSDVYSYSIIKDISSHLHNYYSFDLENKIYIINELLNLLKTNERKTANLEKIGKSSNTGTLILGFKLPIGIKFISESITGYYSKVLFEVK